MATALDPKRTVAELKELRELTGDENGAQRVAFTETWAKARAWLRKKLEPFCPEIRTDEAGNLWATLRGESPRALLIGGHIDSVPNGGWLDGSLDTLAGVEILRRINVQYNGRPPVTVRLVDWADEEGARFGKSLFGSSACSGHLDMDEARALRDKQGVTLPAALERHGIDFEKVKECGKELADAPPTWNCTSSRDPSCSISIGRSAPSSALLASSATPSRFTGKPRIPAARR
jgi:Peptidase family M28